MGHYFAERAINNLILDPIQIERNHLQLDCYRDLFPLTGYY
jgi:hypothetical protein